MTIKFDDIEINSQAEWNEAVAKEPVTKFVKSQKTGEYVKIGPNDMDYNTRFALTDAEMTAERDAIIRAIGSGIGRSTAEQEARFDALIKKARIDQGLDK